MVKKSQYKNRYLRYLLDYAILFAVNISSWGAWRSWKDELVGHTPTKMFCRMTGIQNQFHRMNGTPKIE